MSTSNKLTYLNETKTKLKNAINLTGANITSDTFRQYPDKLYEKYLDILKNGTSTLLANMPRVSDSGTELTLNDTANLPMSVELSASESTQETTNGYQLLNLGSGTNNGHNVNCTRNGDGSFTVSDAGQTGKVNGDYYGFRILIDNSTLKAGTLSLNKIGDEVFPRAMIRVETNTGSYVTFNYNSVNVLQDWLDNDYNIYVTLIAANNSDIVSGTQYLMLYQNGDGNFEPYTGGIASPNPDYPQNINVVTGENSIKINSKNLANIDNLLDGYVSNKFYSHSTAKCYVFDMENYKGESITIQGDGDRLILTSCDTDNLTSGTTVYYVANSSNTSRYTYNIPVELQHRYLCIQFTQTAPLTKIQIEKGSTATSYVPYGNQTYSLSLSTLELCKIGNYADKIFNNVPDNPLYDSNLVEGGWYKYKMIGKGESSNLTSSTLVTSTIASDLIAIVCRVSNIKTDINSKGVIISNLLPPKILGDTTDTANVNNVRFSQGISKHTNISNQIFLSVKKEYLEEETVNGVINFLSDNNFYFNYILATPTTEAITDATLVSELEALESATSYTDQTNISQTNANRPFVISASAIKNSME